MSASAPTLGRALGGWTLDPGTLAALALAAALYALGMRRARRRWPLWRAASFALGLLTLALALLSRLDRYADVLLSLHMVQHLLLLLVAPPLLLWGAPVRLALAASAGDGRRALGEMLRSRAARAAANPAVGLAVFAAVVLSTQLTGIFELALRDPVVHSFEHAAYFWSGMLLFAPLIGDDPLPRPPSAVARFSWLMGAMVVMAVPGGPLTFDRHVWYPYYLAPARALGRSALADQQAAGAIMWIGGGVVMFALALVVTMRAMLAEERRQQRREGYEPARAR